jgi:TRAP-type mannitol/chloroaromatic compound transport system permease small subunit
MVNKFCRLIDTLNEWVGKWSGWMIIPMVILVVYDVTLRYVFNKPTIWVPDIVIQLLGALVILSGGFGVLHGDHVGVDPLVIHLSSRRRAIVDLITSMFFFFTIGGLLWQSVQEAWFAVKTGEHYSSTFLPPIYPFKVVIVVGVLLLLLQGVVKFIRDLMIVISKGVGGRP